MTACTYPGCTCPFDAPPDPAWCAKSLPRAHVVPNIPGLTFTHIPANFDHEKWQCEGEGVTSYGYTPENAHGQWEDDYIARIHIQRAARRIAANPGEKL